MSDQETYSQYFNDALKIHAICVDISLSENDARILTYMHAKASESGKGINYFLNPANEDSEALEIMLGQRKGTIQLPPAASLDAKGQQALDLILTIAERISRIDYMLTQECGLENRLSGELRNRLRLYKDPVFCHSMIDLYNKEILPRLSQYDRGKIDQAFSRFRALEQKREEEIMSMVGKI